MKCFLCDNKINPEKMNWSFIFDGEEVIYAHLLCVQYNEAMERLETEQYLAETLSWQ